MLEKVLPLVINFINNDGLIYIESEKKVSDFCISLGYKIVCSGKSGSVRYHLITIEWKF